MLSKIAGLLGEALNTGAAGPAAPSDGADMLTMIGARSAALSLQVASGLLTVVEDCTVCHVIQKSVSQPLARLAWRALQGNMTAPPIASGLSFFVCAKYWNPRQSQWEPFMEDWQVALEVRHLGRDYF